MRFYSIFQTNYTRYTTIEHFIASSSLKELMAFSRKFISLLVIHFVDYTTNHITVYRIQHTQRIEGSFRRRFKMSFSEKREYILVIFFQKSLILKTILQILNILKAKVRLSIFTMFLALLHRPQKILSKTVPDVYTQITGYYFLYVTDFKGDRLSRSVSSALVSLKHSSQMSICEY